MNITKEVNVKSHELNSNLTWSAVVLMILRLSITVSSASSMPCSLTKTSCTSSSGRPESGEVEETLEPELLSSSNLYNVHKSWTINYYYYFYKNYNYRSS